MINSFYDVIYFFNAISNTYSTWFHRYFVSVLLSTGFLPYDLNYKLCVSGSDDIDPLLVSFPISFTKSEKSSIFIQFLFLYDRIAPGWQSKNTQRTL